MIGGSAYPSPFFVTEENLDGFVKHKVLEGFDEEGESRFGVDAIGGEDQVVFIRDGRWERVTPGMRRGYDGVKVTLRSHDSEEGRKKAKRHTN